MNPDSAVIRADGLSYGARERLILEGIGFSLNPKSWLAVLGENGAGKTTLLDLVMGFKKQTGGQLSVLGHEPTDDLANTRAQTSYLSEKMDIPGDWSIDDFLAFNRFFYPS